MGGGGGFDLSHVANSLRGPPVWFMHMQSKVSDSSAMPAFASLGKDGVFTSSQPAKNNAKTSWTQELPCCASGVTDELSEVSMAVTARRCAAPARTAAHEPAQLSVMDGSSCFSTNQTHFIQPIILDVLRHVTEVTL